MNEEFLARLIKSLLREILKQQRKQFEYFFDELEAQLCQDNPFQILQIPQNATYTQARQAYEELAKQFHPDMGGDAEAMARLNRAWEEIKRCRGWR